MKIRYDLHITFPDGRHEDRSVEFAEPRITAGRGGGSALILDGRGIALEHARFEFRGDKLFIVDVSTDFAVRVNNVEIAEVELRPGDTISIGERILKVAREKGEGDAGAVVLREDRRQAPTDDAEAFIEQALRRVSIRAHMPSMRAAVLCAMAFTLFGAMVIPELSAKTLFTAGTISHPHQMIEAQCESCHTSPFQRVEDSTCLVCHNLSAHASRHVEGAGAVHAVFTVAGVKHAANPHAESGLIGRCSDCHLEHSGDAAISLQESSLCVKCHGEGARSPALQSAMTDLLTVPTFDRHPEFRVSVAAEKLSLESSKSANPRVKRVTLGEPDAKDYTALKLNHAVHLKPGIRGPNGPVTMQCSDCHQLEADYSRMKPITFETNCQSCHRLAFDDELPDDLVPHGQPEDVYNAVFAAYSQLFLEHTKSATIEQITRRLPGQDATRGVERQQDREYARARVQEFARAAEQNLFERTACQLCHEVTKRENVDPVSLESRYDVVRPNVPDSWFPGSIFNHGAHEQMRCETCHQGVEKSQVTTDILLPNIAQCKDCHAHGASEGRRVEGKVQSDCVLCHTFHDSLPIPYSRKR